MLGSGSGLGLGLGLGLGFTSMFSGKAYRFARLVRGVTTSSGSCSPILRATYSSLYMPRHVSEMHTGRVREMHSGHDILVRCVVVIIGELHSGRGV